MEVHDPSQPKKIRLMKMAMFLGVIWGAIVVYLLTVIAYK